jgi:uncharacterized protein
VSGAVCRVILSAGVALLACAPALVAQETKPAGAPASPAQLRRLLAATGEEKLVREMSAEMIGKARAAAEGAAKVTGKPVQGLAVIESAYEPEKLMEIVGSVYASHFSAAEIEEMQRFWESPTGKRLAVLQPQIVVETQEALTKWIGDHVSSPPETGK